MPYKPFVGFSSNLQFITTVQFCTKINCLLRFSGQKVKGQGHDETIYGQKSLVKMHLSGRQFIIEGQLVLIFIRTFIITVLQVVGCWYGSLQWSQPRTYHARIHTDQQSSRSRRWSDERVASCDPQITCCCPYHCWPWHSVLLRWWTVFRSVCTAAAFHCFIFCMLLTADRAIRFREFLRAWKKLQI